eukprot:5960262-Prymnesium_polylepis.1
MKSCVARARAGGHSCSGAKACEARDTKREGSGHEERNATRGRGGGARSAELKRQMRQMRRAGRTGRARTTRGPARSHVAATSLSRRRDMSGARAAAARPTEHAT